jgi:hypothetical protein
MMGKTLWGYLANEEVFKKEEEEFMIFWKAAVGKLSQDKICLLSAWLANFYLKLPYALDWLSAHAEIYADAETILPNILNRNIKKYIKRFDSYDGYVDYHTSNFDDEYDEILDLRGDVIHGIEWCIRGLNEADELYRALKYTREVMFHYFPAGTENIQFWQNLIIEEFEIQRKFIKGLINNETVSINSFREEKIYRQFQESDIIKELDKIRDENNKQWDEIKKHSKPSDGGQGAKVLEKALSGAFEYAEGSGAVTITGYTGSAKQVTIPAQINGLPVTAVGERAFWGNRLIDVTIPDSVAAIGDEAFAKNQLTHLVLPDSVITIGAMAFADNQLTHLAIPDSVTEIEGRAFADNQLTHLTIGNSVKTIGAMAFEENQLTHLAIGNSVKTIGEWAFQENQLTHLTIGNSVTTIGENAFQENQLTHLALPDSVTTIGDGAFSNNQLTGVTIGNSVTTIGECAFRENRLTHLAIPDSVTEIEGRAFADNQLTHLALSGSVAKIRLGAFANNRLTSVTIGANVHIAVDELFQNFAAFPGNFVSVYKQGGRAAGTYASVDEGKTWRKQ